MRTQVCDVLIVGGGGGGLRAALALAEEYPGLRVLLATKGSLGKSGVTALACSDRMAFHATLDHTPPGGPDNWRSHAEDIYRIGGFVSDPKLAEVLASNAKEAFHYLEELGVPFVQRDGLPHQFVTDGSQWPRACYTGPRTAVQIEEKLAESFLRRQIPILEHCMMAELIMEGGRVTGVLALDPQGWVAIGAGEVILATGGAGLIYEANVYPPGMTGDGYAAALRAGAELVNMEFIQLGVASLKTKLNCSGSMFRCLPRLVNDQGEDFLADYLPGTGERHSLIFRKGASWPVSYEHDTRIIDIAIHQEIQARRRVFMNFSTNPEGYDFQLLPLADQERYAEEIRENLGPGVRDIAPINRLREINPDSIRWLKDHGIDLEAGEMVEVAICGQHFQGGIRINSRGETTVPGLYAVGETAGGQHGANRPGGNALLDSQVFGLIAARAAAEQGIKGSEPDSGLAEQLSLELTSQFQGKGLPAGLWRQQLQRTVLKYAGVVRTQAGLDRGLATIRKLQSTRINLAGRNLAFGMENLNMALVAEAVFLAALTRDESRGPHLRFAQQHSRNPLPRLDPLWQRIILVRLGPERLETSTLGGD